MSDSTTHAWGSESTAAQIIEVHPHMREYFDDLGIDDCCLELEIRTIASHLGVGVDELCERIAEACRA